MGIKRQIQVLVYLDGQQAQNNILTLPVFSRLFSKYRRRNGALREWTEVGL